MKKAEKPKKVSSQKSSILSDREKLLTAQEAADYLRIDRSSVTRFVKSGRLRGLKIGSRLLIPASAIQELLIQSEV